VRIENSPGLRSRIPCSRNVSNAAPRSRLPKALFDGYLRDSPKKGESIVLYSDEITWAENASGEDYQAERLTRLLQERFCHDACAMADCLFEDLRLFRGIHPAADDAPLLVIRRRRIRLDTTTN